jgi:hypothetical protein
MLESIIDFFISLLDLSGTIAGPGNKSSVFKVLGFIAWLLILIGIVWLLIKWFP